MQLVRSRSSATCFTGISVFSTTFVAGFAGCQPAAQRLWAARKRSARSWESWLGEPSANLLTTWQAHASPCKPNQLNKKIKIYQDHLFEEFFQQFSNSFHILDICLVGVMIWLWRLRYITFWFEATVLWTIVTYYSCRIWSFKGAVPS